MILFNHAKEVYLQIQPFKDMRVFIKRRGDRFLLVGRTGEIKDKLVKAGFKFSTELKAWLMPPRKLGKPIYQVIGDAIGVNVDMRAYKHLLGRQKQRIMRPVKADGAVRASYQAEVNELLKDVQARVQAIVVPILQKYEGQGGFKNTGALGEVMGAIKHIRANANIEGRAAMVARRVVDLNNQSNKRRFVSHVSEAMGVDITGHI